MDDEATTELPSAQPGYDRAAVEVFFERAATRRSRLEVVIAEASARRDRAVAAQARNRAIALDAQRELEEIRANAEDRATQIVLAARLEAQLLLRSAREQAGIDAENALLIDLREPQPESLSYAHLAASARSDETFNEAAESDYFEYLRGAIRIDAPGTE
jgi:dsDNA-specific endonuclease/ATPase MutS2